jgi:phosphoenolpyruvate---glycerone phosphotransferase subunit DhaL
VSAVSVNVWMSEAEAAISAERDHLTQLDAAIGDGDHGVNMDRGFSAVGKALAGQDGGAPPGRLLVLAGKTLVSTVGGASGPLWGTALRHAGRALGDRDTLDGPGVVEALDAAVAGVVELGAAAPGDKTMVDALAPGLEALRESVDQGQPLADALARAAEAAEEGARATVPMQARKGRASIGHQDPGATSAALIVRALQRAIEPEG